MHDESAGKRSISGGPFSAPALPLATLAVVTCVGGWLRFADLLAQTPFHDEWHALLAALGEPLSELVREFGAADRSIPIAIYLGLCRQLGILGEPTLWLPMAAAGTATIGWLAWLLWRRTGAQAGVLFGLFLALSPLLVYYSRTARPYALTAPLAIASTLALASWCRSPSRRLAAAHVVPAILVGWTLPVHLAFVTGGWIWAGWSRRRLRSSRPDQSSSLAALVLLVAGGLVLLLGPALVHDVQSLSTKLSQGELVGASFLRGAVLLIGGGEWLVALVLGALALVAGARLASTEGGEWLGALACGSTVQVLALVLIRPASLERPLVLARYLLPVGMVIWMLASVAITDGASRWLPRRGASIAVAAITGLMLTSSWVVLPSSSPDNFASWHLFHRIVLPAPVAPKLVEDLPGPYRELEAAPAGSLSIVEVPFAPLRSMPYPYYQRRHRQWVFLGLSSGACALPGAPTLSLGGDDGVRLERFVNLDSPGDLTNPDLDLVILHRDLAEELPWVAESAWRTFDAARCEAALRSTLGPPAGADQRTIWFRVPKGDARVPPRAG